MTELAKELALIKHCKNGHKYWSYFRGTDAIYIMGGAFPDIATCEPMPGGLSRETEDRVRRDVAEKRTNGFVELTVAEKRICLEVQAAKLGVEVPTSLELDNAEFNDDDFSDLGPDLVITYDVFDGDVDAAYAKRNAAMELVERALESAELGEWAACESGVGTVDVIFEVTDADRAKALAVATLIDTKFADYSSLEIVTY